MIFYLLVCLQVSGQDSLSIRDLKAGKFTEDSSYVYALPYQKGKSFMLVQAYHSKNYSHQNEHSLDFKMKEGSEICAAREGVVQETKEDSKAGGVGDEFLSQGNYILIEHNDGSIAGYWHLQFDGALVARGDIVKKGQVIGLSGNTGYTAFPHLHFWVFNLLADGSRQTIPTRFMTKTGARYLRPGFHYRNPE